MNLLKETLTILVRNHKQLTDVEWIGGKDFEIPIAEFISLADTEYNNGYGSPKVATDLIIVGKDFWLERNEYDGSEWWDFKERPQRPSHLKSITRLIGDGYETLSELN